MSISVLMKMIIATIAMILIEGETAQRERHTDRHRLKDRQKKTDKQNDSLKTSQTDRHTDKKPYRQTARQKDQQTEKQADKRTDKENANHSSAISTNLFPTHRPLASATRSATSRGFWCCSCTRPCSRPSPRWASMHSTRPCALQEFPSRISSSERQPEPRSGEGFRTKPGGRM